MLGVRDVSTRPVKPVPESRVSLLVSAVLPLASR